MALTVRSTLPPESERIIARSLGCAVEVHRTLGPGYLEPIYSQAMEIELAACGLAYERERAIVVPYKGHRIAGQRIDFIVEGRLILELKAVVQFAPIHQAALLSYLRSTGIRAGLLINFHAPLLKNGIRRLVV